jgi:hypothetical protein
MEYAIRLTSPDGAPGDPREACPSPWRERLPEGRAVALYFGTEFCEDRIPDLDEACAYCAIARERGWQPTLLTPIVSPQGLSRLDRLLNGLAASGAKPAVVFNDWGVLSLLRTVHRSLPRRAGRLMNRSLRDPRAYRDGEPRATHDASRHRRLRGFLADFGVSAIETDADLDGGYLGERIDHGRGTLQRTLHLPFTFAASGRNCPLKAALYPAGDGFSKALGDTCPAPCRGKPLPVQRADAPLAFWRAGNTVFYEVPAASIEGWLAHTDRVVVHDAPAP